MKEKEWEEYVTRSKTWKIRIGYDFLHSAALRNLRYAPAIKVLFWFHEKIRFRRVNTKKRGAERYERIEAEISFTYDEARWRGLTTQQFSRALKELHSRGFIDILRHGSGLEGDYTIFDICERWRDFATDKFKFVEFPRSNYYGYRKMKETKTTAKIPR